VQVNGKKEKEKEEEEIRAFTFHCLGTFRGSKLFYSISFSAQD
jgi:hypothetical protein